ncbi:MAG: hypothetical protein MUF31_00575 [Akkermansiaceae bacterium]|jgi:hypothetical protein|nr:hypothetical protein [Akkermansiaceae bacterium]
MKQEMEKARKHSWWAVLSNPIFRRYARSRLRPRGLGVALLLSGLVAGFIFALARSVAMNRIGMEISDAERAPLVGLVVLQGVILFVLGTAQVAGGMTAERDEGVIDYQRLLPMSPLAKVLGFLFGLPVREWAMFGVTLPFSVWGLWRGEVETAVWVKLYGVMLSTALLYHLTGLVTGTVVKNRRWAFLVSIGLVFCLYTVIPQLAKFGLVGFQYFTITPVFREALPGLLPRDAGAAVETAQRLLPTVKFFDLDLPEAIFTAFSQAGLILTFVWMLCRRWRRSESHLLDKGWATGFFVWTQVLLLGNALPQVEPGNLFPSRGLTGLVGFARPQPPDANEAVAVIGVYGVFTVVMLWVFASMITPTAERQRAGWRRARKQGRKRLPVAGDAASGFGWVALMAVAGGVAWWIFARGVVESKWFPGQVVDGGVLAGFLLVTVALGLGYQALLEWRGARFVGLSMLLIGVVPLMAGAVLGTVRNSLTPVAAWVMGISPVLIPAYGAGALLDLSELPALLVRAVPAAFKFWTALALLGMLRVAWGLWRERSRIAAGEN